MQISTVLRFAAIGAVAASLVWESTHIADGGNFVWSLLTLLPYAVGVAATISWLAPDGWRLLRRHPDVLVPPGLMIGVLTLVYSPICEKVGLAAPWFTAKLGFVEQGVSLVLLLSLVVHAFAATWLTVMVLDAVRRDRCDLVDSLSRCLPVFPSVLVLLTSAWTLVWVLTVAELSLLLSSGMAVGWFLVGAGLGLLAVLYAWVSAICVLAFRFLINVVTAALLPIFVESKQGFWRALTDGIRQSWQHRRKWLLLLLMQFILAGAWVGVQFQYDNNSRASSRNVSFNFKTNIHAPWTGDYDYDGTWHGRAIGWLGGEEIELFQTAIAMSCLLLAIVIKLAIVERLPIVSPSSDESDDDLPQHEVPLDEA
jgi:hypothetical protein